MPNNAEIIHHLGDFIQERSLGALIRQWLDMDEKRQLSEMALYRFRSSLSDIQGMENALLNIAAGYPNCDVRKKLVRTYALFMYSADLEHAGS